MQVRSGLYEGGGNGVGEKQLKFFQVDLTGISDRLDEGFERRISFYSFP